MSDERILFEGLDGRGPFHRDTAIGRVFHPGTVSFREIAASDSLHVTVAPDNRVSVHVDRLSPLAIRPGHPSRYSVLRAVAHNVAHVADVARSMLQRRRDARRCDLDCEASATPGTYEFSCKAAGADGCGWSTRAGTEEELLAKVAQHCREVHGVKSFNGTLASYALGVSTTH
jgi:predicted small metal-binding protein